MSRISDLEQVRHFIITDEEVNKRFHKLINDFGLPVHNGLDLKNITGHRFPSQVFINSNFHGNTNLNTLESSVFFESSFAGNVIGNNFRQSDFLGGSIEGRFLQNLTQGSYFRFVDVSRTIFTDSQPKQHIKLPVDEVTVHQTTGRIIFCSGVENSIVNSEEVATFRPINIKLSNDSVLSFLARLYFDGEHHKLGLITTNDILFESLDYKSRLWPNFIYTLTNESKLLRDQIEEDFLRDISFLQSGQPRILPELEYGDFGKIALRPARPLDMTFLKENVTQIPVSITKHLSSLSF